VAAVSAELGAIVLKNLQNSSISAPFGQLNSVLSKPTNSAKKILHTQNPVIPIFNDHCFSQKVENVALRAMLESYEAGKRKLPKIT